MKRTYLLVLILLLVACDTSAANPTGELTVTNVRANLSLPTDTGSVWMKIMNGTDAGDTLVGAELEGCGAVELHNMIMENDIMIMREVEDGEIPIPAGEMVELKQGGLHVMCIDKAAPLELGTSVDITLQFTNAGDIIVTGEVVAPGEMNMEMGGDHSDMDMDGEDNSNMNMEEDG